MKVELRGHCTNTSPHVKHWTAAIPVLQNMCYVDKEGKTPVKTDIPCLQNWILTLRGFIKIWEILSGKYNFTSLNTRYLNQDVLENFFGQIRSHRVRCNSPTSVQFDQSFKTFLINSITSLNIKNGNCEFVQGQSFAINLEHYFDLDENYGDCTPESTNDLYTVNLPSEIVLIDRPHERADLKSEILKKLNSCLECSDCLHDEKSIRVQKMLLTLGAKMSRCVVKTKNAKKELLKYLKSVDVEMDWHSCILHYNVMSDVLLNSVCSVSLKSWCFDKNLQINEKKTVLYNDSSLQMIMTPPANRIRKLNVEKTSKSKLSFGQP